MAKDTGGKAIKVIASVLTLIALFSCFAVRHWMLFARTGGMPDLAIGASCSVAVVIIVGFAVRLVF
jgi:hypothetical protein